VPELTQLLLKRKKFGIKKNNSNYYKAVQQSFDLHILPLPAQYILCSSKATQKEVFYASFHTSAVLVTSCAGGPS
jgi:hypothetical protein